jgi:hypothetical protein
MDRQLLQTLQKLLLPASENANMKGRCNYAITIFADRYFACVRNWLLSQQQQKKH